MTTNPFNIPAKFHHPLSDWGQIVEDQNGERTETCNLWATASLITWQYYQGNPEAEKMAIDCINAGGECPSLLALAIGVDLGQDESIQNCITYIQGGLMKKMTAAFDTAQNQPPNP